MPNPVVECNCLCWLSINRNQLAVNQLLMYQALRRFDMRAFLLVLLGVAAVLADEGLKDFSDASFKLTAGVYKELSKSNPGSFMVCPLSVDVLLALFHAGAKGKTGQEISEGLNLPDSRAKIDEAFTKLSSQLKSTKDYDLISANKVYLNNDFQISDQFKSTATNVFDSEIQNLDFGRSQESANEMNHWVEEKTHNKIKDLVSPVDLQGHPAAVLVNAMYFRGKWVTQFRSHGTKARPFHVNTNKEIQVETMEMSDEFNGYVSDELNAKFLEMPYEGDDISMTFVLPNDVEGLATLEERITDVLVAPAYHHGRAHVIIPKFKLETTVKFVPILEALGIQEAFSNNADFTGFGANEDRLKISKILQKTFIEVEEEGTTAAAGTAGFLRPLSANYVAPPVLEFVADHPFIYYIKVKGVIVFVGRYTGPN